MQIMTQRFSQGQPFTATMSLYFPSLQQLRVSPNSPRKHPCVIVRQKRSGALLLESRSIRVGILGNFCNVFVRQSFDPREGYHVASSLRKQVLRAPEILFKE